MSYRHTQFGYVIVGLLVALIAATCVSIAAAEAPPGTLLCLVLLGSCLLLFPSLTTEVQKESVRCAFGFGLIRREIAVQDITSVSVVHNAWHYGWGLRWIPGGSMWNVSGLTAVELCLRGGRRFRIGTDEPQKLREAISNALSGAPR